MGSRALWRRCLCGSLPRGELFKQSFPSSEPPRSALPTRPGSCRCRQGSGGGGSVPRWAQSCVSPGFACEAVQGAGAHGDTHTRCCSESHQHACELGVIFMNLPGLRLDLELSCMDGHGKASSCGQARSVRLWISILPSRWGQDHRRKLGGIHIPGGTSGNTSLKHPQSLKIEVEGHTSPPFNTPGMQHLLHGVKWSRMPREEGL